MGVRGINNNNYCINILYVAYKATKVNKNGCETKNIIEKLSITSRLLKY